MSIYPKILLASLLASAGSQTPAEAAPPRMKVRLVKHKTHGFGAVATITRGSWLRQRLGSRKRVSLSFFADGKTKVSGEATSGPVSTAYASQNYIYTQREFDFPGLWLRSSFKTLTAKPRTDGSGVRATGFESRGAKVGYKRAATHEITATPTGVEHRIETPRGVEVRRLTDRGLAVERTPPE